VTVAETLANGILFVISAPSGTGKSTVARELIARVEELDFSVSYTTRPRRDGEQEGCDYHFVVRTEFESMIEAGAFVEWADVFGHLYGTSRAATRAVLESGRHLLLDIDVQGARQVRESDHPSVSIMLLPPDFPTLERRLRSRGSESDEQRSQRLARARPEAEDYRFFDYVVINEELAGTVQQLETIVRAEPCRTARQRPRVQSILTTFPR
jgi:guanylate kinase